MTVELIGGVGTTELILILFFLTIMAAVAIGAVVVIARLATRGSRRPPQG